MSEIEKMYKNANITPDCTYLFLVDGNGENKAARTISIGSKADLKRLIVDCGVKGRVIKSTNTLKPFYPPFTAEKQIAILITLANYNLYEDDKRLLIDSFNGEIYIGFYQDITLTANATDTDFAECVAKLINNLWQDLTEEEKQQVKGILE